MSAAVLALVVDAIANEAEAEAGQAYTDAMLASHDSDYCLDEWFGAIDQVARRWVSLDIDVWGAIDGGFVAWVVTTNGVEVLV